MNKSKGIIGLIVTLLIILALVGTKVWMDRNATNDNKLTVVKCLVGGEKMALMADPAMEQLLADNGLKIDAIKRGSIEMVSDPASLGEDIDCVWPSNQVALSMFRVNGGNPLKAENVFNSPIVIYSWAPITDALMKDGVVTAELNPAIENGVCTEADRSACIYFVDFRQLATLVESGSTWSEIGLPQMFGPIKIHSTDPTKSNSGNMYAGLLANTYADGLVTEQSINQVLPKVIPFFQNQGFMSESSGDIFQQYIEQGAGTYPLVMGYESQIVEFALAHAGDDALANQLRDQVRILYPRPTVWAQHPLIARTENGEKLLDVLLGADAQRLAWEQHGFRSGAGETGDVLTSIPVSGQLSNDILSVMDMPNVATMKRLLDGLADPASVPTQEAAPSGTLPLEPRRDRRVHAVERRIA